MRYVLIVAAMVLVLLAVASVPAAIVYWYSASEDRQKRYLNEFLSAAQLNVDNETWSALRRFASRRARWGAIGAGLGFAAGLPISQALDPTDGDWGVVFNVAMLFAGLAFGNALSSQMSPHLSADVPRVSLLQQHSISDYLEPRAIAAEGIVAALGVAASITGFMLLGANRTSRATAFVVLGTGLILSAISALALLLERRLVRAPVRAEGPSHLVAHDVRLALGLRDLIGVSLSTAVLCGYALLLWIDVPVWVPYVSLAVLIGLARLLFDPKPSAPKVPVAHKIAGVHPA